MTKWPNWHTNKLAKQNFGVYTSKFEPPTTHIQTTWYTNFVVLIYNSVTNFNHGNRFLLWRRLILTIELLNLDKRNCIFKLNLACAQKDRLAQRRNWTSMDGYKYKLSDPHLDISMVILLSFGSACTPLRLGCEYFLVQVWDCRV